jgi:hypothetical protein
MTDYAEQARLVREATSRKNADSRAQYEQRFADLADEIRDEIPRALDRWAKKGFPGQEMIHAGFTKRGDTYGRLVGSVRAKNSLDRWYTCYVFLTIEGKLADKSSPKVYFEENPKWLEYPKYLRRSIYSEQSTMKELLEILRNFAR